jgi:hypothetical protein
VSRDLHARPRWELDRALARRQREELIAHTFLGWCLGVLTFAAALLVLR